MTLYVGTSGWAYKEWKPAFYPSDLPQARFLEHYAKELGACEINATFYRLQTEETFRRWVSASPDGFRFAVKAHRRLTHARGIAPEGDRRNFLDLFLRSLAPLRDRLGILFFQFPPHRRRDDDALAALLDALPDDVPCAFEFRHDSWADTTVRDLVAPRGTVVVSETAGEVPSELPQGRIGYVRLRAERYQDGARSGWQSLLQREAQERDVYAFAKHEGIPAGDPYGGIGLAHWLHRSLMAEARQGE